MSRFGSIWSSILQQSLVLLGSAHPNLRVQFSGLDALTPTPSLPSPSPTFIPFQTGS